MKIFRKNKYNINTSIEGYKKCGIDVTQEQLDELAVINSFIKMGAYDDIPVHPIVLVLHAFRLI